VQYEQYKSYKPTYILADKAYDTEIIKQRITEETTTLPQIPVNKTKKAVPIEASVEQYSDLIIYRFNKPS